MCVIMLQLEEEDGLLRPGVLTTGRIRKEVSRTAVIFAYLLLHKIPIRDFYYWGKGHRPTSVSIATQIHIRGRARSRTPLPTPSKRVLVFYNISISPQRLPCVHVISLPSRNSSEKIP